MYLRYKDLKRNDLLTLCKCFNIKGVSSQCKEHILMKLNNSIAALKIQRFYRNIHMKYKYINFTDPITLDPIRMIHNNYVFIKLKNMNVARYDPVSLYKYLMISGKFVDPLTKVPLSLQTLHYIDKTMHNDRNRKNRKLVELYNEQSDYDENILLCMGLDRQMGNIISYIIQILESTNIIPEAYNAAYNVHSHDFKYLFDSLYSIDCQYARNAVKDIFDMYVHSCECSNDCADKSSSQNVLSKHMLYKFYYRLLNMCI